MSRITNGQDPARASAAGAASAVPADAGLPLVVHLVYRLDFGGLETVLVECINRMAPDTYRHAIVCLTDATAFADKITRPGVTIHALHKPPGLGLSTHLTFWKLMRTLRPTILHTYNVSAVEYSLTAALAGVPIRVHAEHGRDLSDIHGTNRRHALLRRWMTPFIDCFVPVSRDLRQWLSDVIGVPAQKNLLINNGVDTAHFAPAPIAATGAQVSRPFVIGTVGRVQDIKNHAGLVEIFLRLRAMLAERLPGASARELRLTIVGDGPLMPALRAQVAASGASESIHLTGARSDVADLMRSFDVFILPSFNEGTPITLLEAMSCALPVVASRVGGIPEAVREGESGLLAAPADQEAMAAALAAYVNDAALLRRHGDAGRRIVETTYSIDAMLAAYTGLYDTLRRRKLRATLTRKPVTSCVE